MTEENGDYAERIAYKDPEGYLTKKSLQGTPKKLTIRVIGTNKEVKGIRKQLKRAGNRRAKVKRLKSE